MIIRPQTEADRPAVQEVRRRAWKQAYEGILPAAIIEEATSPNPARGKRGGLIVPNHVLSSRVSFVACEGETILGFAAGGLPREEIVNADCELWAIYVDPERQSSGIGKQLLETFLGEMKEIGKTRMVLWALKENHPARHFYESQGGLLQPEEKSFRWNGEEVAQEVAYLWELKKV
jgi:ribosomal protein S18 acetylase RimI-like enzyme